LHEIPEKVWVIGLARPLATRHTPIRAREGEGLAPLTVLDPDGERALPVFTTRDKAERGILHFMTEEQRADGPVAYVLIRLEELVDVFQGPQPEGVPKVDYIGVNMGEGGIYPLLRL
jgi:type III secretion system (T3SS) SseB-like protein